MTKTKIALVTGGSRGLGKNMAIALAKKGLDVILTYNSKKDEAEAVVKEIQSLGRRAATLQFNAGEIGTFESFVGSIKKVLNEKFSSDKLDYLINNAGIGIHAMVSDTTPEQFDLLTNIHFKGPFFLTQKLLPTLADGGGIVNISTGLARFSMPGYSVYGSLKAGMESMTRYMATELGGRKIRVNIVAPGAIETDFGGGAVRDNEQVKAMVSAATALGRPGLPDDIGGVVAFLCTEDAKWVNGQRIEVSGGMNL